MLNDLTRLAEEGTGGRPKLVKDSGLTGKRYGVMFQGGKEIRVSPALYDLLVTADGSLAPDFEAVSKTLKVRIVKRRRRKAKALDQ